MGALVDGLRALGVVTRWGVGRGASDGVERLCLCLAWLLFWAAALQLQVHAQLRVVAVLLVQLLVPLLPGVCLGLQVLTATAPALRVQRQVCLGQLFRGGCGHGDIIPQVRLRVQPAVRKARPGCSTSGCA